MKYLKLNNGIEIPSIGFGVFRAKQGDETKNAVIMALKNGYRLIDTAQAYYNEESVGEGIIESKIKREEIFLTTKLWTDDVRNHTTKKAFYESLEKLKTDYLDLYLIHWPAKGFEQAFLDMIDLYKEGKVRAIGVSNFKKHHLEELKKVTDFIPQVNQIEVHPYFTNREDTIYSQKQGIVVEGYKTLAGGQIPHDEPVLNKLANKYHKTIPQIIIRWSYQLNVIPLVKSVHEDRIKANLDIFDFSLTEKEIEEINSLNKNQKIGSDPDTFKF